MSGNLNSEMKPKVARAKAVINHILIASTFDQYKAEAVYHLIEWLHGIYWSLTGENYRGSQAEAPAEKVRCLNPGVLQGARCWMLGGRPGMIKGVTMDEGPGGKMVVQLDVVPGEFSFDIYPQTDRFFIDLEKN